MSDAPEHPATPQQRFGELRALLQAPPGRLSWGMICDLLARWEDADDAGLDQALGYAARQLDRWPDRLRVVPLRWLHRSARGRPPRALTLCRHLAAALDDSPESAALMDRSLRQLPRAQLSLGALSIRGRHHLLPRHLGPLLGHLQQLHLDGGALAANADTFTAATSLPRLDALCVDPAGLDPRHVAALATGPLFQGLQSLALGPGPCEPLLFALLQDDRLGGLQRLSIRGSKLSHSSLLQLAGAPQLAAVTDLQLSAVGLDDAAAAKLAGAPLLADLRALDLCDNPALSTEGITALLQQSPLHTLRLRGCLGGDALAIALASCDALAELEVLELSSCGMSWRGLEALATAPHLERLRVLRLRDNVIKGSRGARAAAGLQGAAFASGLEELDLGGKNKIGPRGAASLASLPALRRLSLARNDIGIEGLRAICRPGALPALTTLNVAGNKLGPPAMAALAARPPGLRELSVGTAYVRNEVGDAGLAALLDGPALSTVERLNLYNARIGSEGARALASSPSVARLLSLSLSLNTIGDDGVHGLATSPRLGHLRQLSLESNDISDLGAAYLVGSTTLTNLDVLFLDGNPLTAHAGCSVLQHHPRLGTLEVLSLPRHGGYFSFSPLAPASQASLAVFDARLHRPYELWFGFHTPDDSR